MDQIFVELSLTPLSITDAADFVNGDENGALNMFIGKVRNHNLGKPVLAVSYDAYAPMVAKVFREICTEAIAKFDPNMRCYLTHYKGRLEIGGISVVIAVGSAHREPTFLGCRYIIEELKKRAPIWKKEHYVDGDDEWLAGHELGLENV
jgi:molybdopterin synthase catalytic subunit